jgi:hypothetical protein
MNAGKSIRHEHMMPTSTSSALRYISYKQYGRNSFSGAERTTTCQCLPCSMMHPNCFEALVYWLDVLYLQRMHWNRLVSTQSSNRTSQLG